MLKKHTLRMFSDSLSRMRDADLSEMSNTRGAGAKLKLNGGPRTRKQTPSVLICKKAQYGSLERQVIIIIIKKSELICFSTSEMCEKRNIFKGPFSTHLSGLPYLQIPNFLFWSKCFSAGRSHSF